MTKYIPKFGFLAIAALMMLSCNLAGYRPTPTPTKKEPGDWINPYLAAGMTGVTAVQVQAEGAPSTLTGAALDALLDALNVSVQAAARDLLCPDHLRLVFIWGDSTEQLTLRACLDGVVMLRGVPGAGELDVPLYGAASDALSPYLPNELNDRLDF